MTYAHPQTVADVARQVDHYEWTKKHFPSLYEAETRLIEVIPPGKILLTAVELLKQRGRSYGSYDNHQGELCVLGAMAVAAGKDADCWEGLRNVYPGGMGDGDAELVEAALRLIRVIPVDVDLDDLMVEDLIGAIGGWHDGTWNGEDSEADMPTNAQVFAALVEASRLTEKAGAAR